jgi:Ni/Co efflux regulator RcnB
MKKGNKAILAAAAAAIGLGLSATAFADGGRGHRHGGHDRHWDRHHHQDPYRHHGRRHIDRSVYVAPYHYAPPVYSGHYYAPPVYSGYYYPPAPRYPGIVVNVDIPPLVIPLR